MRARITGVLVIALLVGACAPHPVVRQVVTGDDAGGAGDVDAAPVAPLAAKYQLVAVPVICLEPAVFPHMKMTDVKATDFGVATGAQIVVATSAHPIAAGLTSTVPVTTMAALALGWGVPAPTADRIA